jgi:dolichol-phosphate mannosyltransferase
MGRRVVEELVRLREKDPYLRGLVTWLGFKQTPVFYERAPRAKGRTHFPLFRSKGPITTFIFGFTSFSVLPLVGFLLLGFLLTATAVLSAFTLCAMKLLAIETTSGVWLVVALVFFRAFS